MTLKLKTIFPVISLVFSNLVFLTPLAHSSSMLEARFDRAEMDSRLQLAGSGFEITAEISMASRNVMLVLSPKWACPQGQYCITLMPTPYRIELPLVSVSRDECGVSLYRAVSDQLASNGGLEELLIIDRSESTCFAIGSLPLLEASFATLYPEPSGSEIRTFSKFYGRSPIREIE